MGGRLAMGLRETAMDRLAYQRYLGHFNSRDYDSVVAHFQPEAEVRFGGVVLKGQAAIREFYAFFHEYVIETITVSRFAASDQLVALEATVRLEATRELTSGRLAGQGYPGLVPLSAGEVIEMPQFIHYHMVDGKFSLAVCLVNPEL